MAAMVAILNFLNNIFSETVLQIEPKLGERHQGNVEIQTCFNRFVRIYKVSAMAAIRKFFKHHLLQNHMSH